MTLAAALKRGGYATAAIGKWHLGDQEYRPETHGFDLNFGGDHRGQPPSYFWPYKIPVITSGKPGEYLTDRLTDEAEKFIEKNRDRPFFLYLAHYAVHMPLMAKQALIAKYQAKIHKGQAQHNATYAGMIDSVDQSVDRVLKKLDALGLAANTVVIYTSDNGGLLQSTSNLPLRAGKGSPFEGGTRVPLIVRWPGTVVPGSVCHAPVIGVDFYPTILEIAGVAGDARHNARLDGELLRPLLAQATGLKRDAIFWHYPHYHPGGATPYSAVRQGDFKLIEFHEDHHAELYCLKDDIGETKELSARLPDKARQLRQLLADWRTKVGAQMPTPNPKFSPARNAKRAVAQLDRMVQEP